MPNCARKAARASSVKLGTRLRFAVASPGSARNSTKLKLTAMKAMTSALPARRRMKRWRLLTTDSKETVSLCDPSAQPSTGPPAC